MKTWPENGAPAMFDEIAEPLIEAIRFAYRLERKNPDKDIPWTGIRIVESKFEPSPFLKRLKLFLNKEGTAVDVMRAWLSGKQPKGLSRFKVPEIVPRTVPQTMVE